MDKACKEFKEEIIDEVFKDPQFQLLQGLFCYTPLYQDLLKPIKGVIEVIEIFGIKPLEISKRYLQTILSYLENPDVVRHKELFQDYIGKLLKVFSKKTIKKEIQDKLSILSSEEISRLNEAIHCFLEECNYSAVAMSVSAIEFRLLSLMISACPDSRIERMTLGQLISEYLNNKEKYGRVIPKKYEPLLEHCNTYRIFSVHPKREKINKSVATSILHMTFQFLLDKNLIQKSSPDKKVSVHIKK